MARFFEPVVFNEKPIGFKYSELYGAYVTEIIDPQYYIAPVKELYERTVNGVVIERWAKGCYWLKPRLLRREIGTNSPETDFCPVHARLASKRTFLITEIVPVSGKYIELTVDKLDPVQIIFVSDLTIHQIATLINTKLSYLNVDYSYVARVEANHLVLSTETPQFNPKSPLNNVICISAGTGAEVLGFEVGDQSVGDIPVEYNNAQDFYLLMAKRSDCVRPLEAFIPVIEKNMLIEKAMAGFDSALVKQSKRRKLFFDGIAWAMDCAEREIERLLDSLDVDKIDIKYLQNVSATVGYNIAELGPITDDAKRDVIKNIINIYRAKGTPWSFDVMFRFLGYFATVWERTSDASKGYPLIVIVPDADDIEEYYQKFLQKDNFNEFFDKFLWFYVNSNDSDERMTARRWWEAQLLSGFDFEILDAHDNVIQPASMLTTLLGPWDLSADKGEMRLSLHCNPDLQIGEDVYIGAIYVGRIVRKITSTRYEIEFRDGVLDAVIPSDPVTGNMGGGSIHPGVFDLFNPNDKCRIRIDDRYVWEIDLTRHSSLFLESQRIAQSDELEQALQLLAAEQNVPVKIRRLGDAVQIESLTYGDQSKIEILRGNLSIGWNEYDKAPLTPTEKADRIRFIPGYARVQFNGEWVTGSSVITQTFGLNSFTSKFYFYLPDRMIPSSGQIVTENVVSGSRLESIALLLGITYQGIAGNVSVSALPVREDYRIPYISELTENQYEQLRIFVRHKRNNSNYWTAAGNPDAITNPDLQHPWLKPDLTAYPGLGNSIFCRLDLVPFVEEIDAITTEDIFRLVALSEFLRPIHAVFDIVIQALNTTDRIVDLPYDPEYFLSPLWPELYGGQEVGNNVGYFWGKLSPGPNIQEKWWFEWFNPHPTWTGIWPQPVVQHFKPTYKSFPWPGPPATPFTPVAPFYVDQHMTPLEAPPVGPWNIPPAGFAPAPHRVALWTYENYWFKRDPITGAWLGNDVLDGTFNALDMVGYYPIWEICSTGDSLKHLEIYEEPQRGYLMVRSSVSAGRPFKPGTRIVVDTLADTKVFFVWRDFYTTPNTPQKIEIFPWGNMTTLPSSGDLIKYPANGGEVTGGSFYVLTPLPATFLAPTFVEMVGKDFTIFKPESPDFETRAIVITKDMNGDDFWGYINWNTLYGEDKTRMYVFNDPTGTIPGWLNFGTNIPGVPNSAASSLMVYIIQTHWGDFADRVQQQVFYGVDRADYYDWPPFDVWSARADMCGWGLYPEFPTPVMIPGSSTMPSNRTWGWFDSYVSTGNPLLDEMYGTDPRGIKSFCDDLYPLIILKTPVSPIPSFDNAFYAMPWTYDPDTGIVQYNAPVDLSWVRPGDFFEFDPGYPILPAYMTVIGVDDANDRLFCFPFRFVGAPWFSVVGGSVFYPLLVTSTTLTSLFSADWVSGALSSFKSYEELTPIDFLDHTDKYWVCGSIEIKTSYDPLAFPPSPPIWVESIVNNFTQGIFFVGAP